MVRNFVSLPRRNRLPLCVFLSSLLITLVGWRWAVHQEQAAAYVQFDHATDIYADRLQSRIDTYVRFLEDLSGLFEASDFVTSKEFAKYINHANIVANYPGTNRIIYEPWVPAGQKAAHEKQMHSAGFAAYRIKADAAQSEYFPFSYVYPLDANGIQLLGRDVHTDPMRQEAMRKARDTNQVIGSAPLSLLVVPRQHASFVLFSPVYHSDAPLRSVAERRQALQGFVVAAFQVDTLAKSTWGNGLNQIADVRIYDGTRPASNTLFYASRLPELHNQPCAQCLKHVDVIHVAGRQWSVEFIAHPAFLAASQSRTPETILVAGWMVSLLLTGIAAQRNQRRLLQKLRHEQNQKFRSLFEQNPDAVYSFDLKGNFTEANPATALLTRVPVNELIGKSYAPWIAPECLEDSRKRFAQAASGFPTYGEISIINHAGERIEISTTNLPIIVDGKAIGVFGIAKDITSRKSAERQNRQMHQFLDATLEHLPTTLFVKEAGTLRFIAWNKACEELMGIGREEIIGKTDYDFLAKQDADFYAATDREILAHGQAVTLPDEAVHTRYRGVRWLQTKKVPFRMGETQYLLGISEDITERRQAEEALKKAHAELEERVRQRTRALRNEIDARKESERALRESEEKYRSIFEQAPVGIAHIGLDGRWQKTNQKLSEIVGYSAEELTEMTFIDLTYPEDLAQSVEQVRRVTEDNTVNIAYEKRYVRKNGDLVWVNVTRSAIRSESGDTLYYLSIIEDITQRKEAEAALRELTRHLQAAREDERTRIAREIHDELGGVLTAVKFDLSIPVRQDDRDPSGIARRNAETSRLVDHAIVALRRIMADLRPSVLDDLGLWAALDWLAAEFEARMGIRTLFSLKGEETDLEPGRATALFRMVQEALHNVAKHAQATEVWISAIVTGDDLIIRIHDNGRGISKDEKSRPGAFGIIGMQERAQAFGGVVKISGRPGKGTTVSIKFPVKDQ